MEPAGELPTEIVLLAWSVILLLLQIVLQGVTGASELKLGYLMTARDEGRQATNIYAGRLSRALANLLETYPAFVALALALAVTGKAGGAGAVGAHLWFWARLLYIPAYGFGIPVVRTLLWAVSMVGLILMLIRLLS